MAIAKKKVGRPATKAAPKKRGRPAAKKVGRPRKTKVPPIEERMGWTYDHVAQKWTKSLNDFDINDLRSMFGKLSFRVGAIENKIEEAERAGAKIQSDLEQWRKHSAPKWKSRQPADGKPSIAHAKILIMTRDGEKSTIPCSVDAYSWGELGDRTIIAYAVV